MKNQRRSLLISILLSGYLTASAAVINHVDPQFWWVGMKNKELQLMVHGADISGSRVSVDYPGVKVKEVDSVESPNYLFIYLEITSSAYPGTMNIEFTDGAENPRAPGLELRSFNSKG